MARDLDLSSCAQDPFTRREVSLRESSAHRVTPWALGAVDLVAVVTYDRRAVQIGNWIGKPTRAVALIAAGAAGAGAAVAVASVPDSGG
jgi:hypothetical protein